MSGVAGGGRVPGLPMGIQHWRPLGLSSPALLLPLTRVGRAAGQPELGSENVAPPGRFREGKRDRHAPALEPLLRYL